MILWRLYSGMSQRFLSGFVGSIWKGGGDNGEHYWYKVVYCGIYMGRLQHVWVVVAWDGDQCRGLTV